MNVGEGLLLQAANPHESVIVTVLAVADNVTASSATDDPGPGTRYYAVEYRVHNVGGRNLSDAPLIGCHVTGPDRYQMRYSAIGIKIKGKPMLPIVLNVAPGGTATGWVAFVVPNSVAVQDVQYQPGSDGAIGHWKP